MLLHRRVEDDVTGLAAATGDRDTSPGSARSFNTSDHTPILLVELSGRALDFHRLVATLHRKNAAFTSLLFARRRAMVWLAPGHRSTELLASAIEREPAVISVEVRYIDPRVVDRVIGELLDL
jgi:hypothetical protein